MVSLILFDCDGTLVDSQHVIIKTMNRAFEDHGLTPPSAEATRAIVGLSLETAMARLAPQQETADHVRLADGYREAFTELRQTEDLAEPMFEGAREVLDHLAKMDIQLGVATGKGMRGLKMVLDHHGLNDHFVTLQTADFHPSKPHPSMVETAMRETGATPETTWLLGDTSFDMEMTTAAGARAIGVRWGYHPSEVLLQSGAELVLDRFQQLSDLVEAARG